MINWTLPETDILEENQQWNDAKNHLYQQWLEQKNDTKIACKLGFLCWYILVEDVSSEQQIDEAEFQKLLIEVYHYGERHFQNDAIFNWLFGYMISQFPYLFGDFKKKEEIGTEMLAKAYQTDPDQLIFEYTFLGNSIVVNQRYKEIEKEIQAHLSQFFPGNGLLSTYFKDIWQY
ncbi:hypothetical protein AB4Y30_12160 [Ornithinibacillus sp. 4-3]|uniref:DUF4274 domain-containing protein n=1 Tax=Ornithinibacillus sp. 4-3 TaxID=3231488 RepID=A0AB39HP18_9BACI